VGRDCTIGSYTRGGRQRASLDLADLFADGRMTALLGAGEGDWDVLRAETGDAWQAMEILSDLVGGERLDTAYAAGLVCAEWLLAETGRRREVRFVLPDGTVAEEAHRVRAGRR
jgi:hypothetical protein